MSDPTTRHPERAVAIVNALVVLLLPPILLFAGSVLIPDRSSNTTVTVRAPGGSATAYVSGLLTILRALLPFAMLAGWRSLVYARRWCEQSDRGWRAVGEAGACGLAVALLALAPGILTRPLEAPPYLIVYGGAAAVLGLAVGLLLRLTAILVLKLYGPALA